MNGRDEVPDDVLNPEVMDLPARVEDAPMATVAHPVYQLDAAAAAREQAGSTVMVDRPVEGKAIEVPLELDKHYYAVEARAKNEETGRWETTVHHYEMLRTGLLLLCGKAGVSIRSWAMENRRGYARAMAEGEYLWPSGYLERFTREQEYDADREFEKSLLKLAQSAHREQLEKAPADTDPRSFLTAAESTRLRLAQLEILTHLLAHCRSRAEDQAMRYFLYKMGAPLQVSPAEARDPIVARLVRTRETFAGQADDPESLLYGTQIPSVPPDQRGRATDPRAGAAAPPPSSDDATAARPQADVSEPPTERDAPPPPDTPAGETAHCDTCGKKLSARQLDYIKKHAAHFGEANLCYDCDHAEPAG